MLDCKFHTNPNDVWITTHQHEIAQQDDCIWAYHDSSAYGHWYMITRPIKIPKPEAGEDIVLSMETVVNLSPSRYPYSNYQWNVLSFTFRDSNNKPAWTIQLRAIYSTNATVDAIGFRLLEWDTSQTNDLLEHCAYCCIGAYELTQHINTYLSSTAGVTDPKKIRLDIFQSKVAGGAYKVRIALYFDDVLKYDPTDVVIVDTGLINEGVCEIGIGGQRYDTNDGGFIKLYNLRVLV